jgi:hypothetical protein
MSKSIALPSRIFCGHRGNVVPFPLAKQIPLIKRIALRLAAQLPARAEKNLHAELERRTDALHRQGLPDRQVEREVHAFETAIRAELWRIVLLRPTPDKGA